MRLLSKIGVATAACGLMVFAPVSASAALVTLATNQTLFYVGENCTNCSANATFDLTSATELVITINNTSGFPPNNFLTQLLVDSDPDINITGATFTIDNVATTAWNFDNGQGQWKFGVNANGVNDGTVIGGQTLVATLTISTLNPIELNLTDSQIHWQNTCNGNTVPSGDPPNCGDSDKGDGGPGGGVINGTSNGGSVPEPASVSLFGIGLLGAAWRARRRRVVN